MRCSRRRSALLVWLGVLSAKGPLLLNLSLCPVVLKSPFLCFFLSPGPGLPQLLVFNPLQQFLLGLDAFLQRDDLTNHPPSDVPQLCQVRLKDRLLTPV